MSANSTKPTRRLILEHNLHVARKLVRKAQSSGQRVGLVPTMGALHNGHISLVRAALRDCQFVVATIFVNPTQFGSQEDLAKYPRTLESDLEKLEAANTSLVFVPEATDIYPPGFSTYVEPPSVAKLWEAERRPGHFRGVCTVVLKLFSILPADVAYFGQKDYQQCAVIQRMVTDLDLPIEIQICPTVRDADGLAMSSRNTYLSPTERERSLGISRGLRHAEALVAAGEKNSSVLVERVAEVLNKSGIDSVDYIAVVEPGTLEPASRVDAPKVLLIAAFVGKTRLIDNTRIG